MAFENKAPEWNAAGIEPPASLKNSGFTEGYKPPAPYFNWFWYAVSKCLAELQSMTPEDIGALSKEGGTIEGALNLLDTLKFGDGAQYMSLNDLGFVILKDGKVMSIMSDTIQFIGNNTGRIRGLGAPVEDADAVNKKYVATNYVSRAEWEASLLRNASVE